MRHGKAAVVRQRQAHAPHASGVLPRHASQGRTHLRLGISKAQGPRRRGEAREVPFKARIDAVVQAQRFDQQETGIEARQETRFQQALGVFARRVGVDHDAAADAQLRAPVGLDLKRADGDVKAAVAARREVADGAGIDAARPRLQAVDELHGTDFGRAGDRAAGKERGKNLGQRYARQLGRDRRHHLPQRRVGLARAQRLDAHAARRGEPPEVVAQEVDDHHVLGSLLGRSLQGHAPRLVIDGIDATRRGPLHRPGDDTRALALEKEFGRARKQRRLPRARRDEGAVAHRLASAQGGVERQRMAVNLEVEREGEVDLVALAVGDPALHLLDARRVLRLRERRRQLSDASAALGFGEGREARGQPGVERFGGQRLRVGKTPGTQAACAVRDVQQGRIARRAKRVIGGQRHPLALPGGRFQTAQQAGQSARRIGLAGEVLIERRLQAAQQPGAAVIALEDGEGGEGGIGVGIGKRHGLRQRNEVRAADALRRVGKRKTQETVIYDGRRTRKPGRLHGSRRARCRSAWRRRENPSPRPDR